MQFLILLLAILALARATEPCSEGTVLDPSGNDCEPIHKVYAVVEMAATLVTDISAADFSNGLEGTLKSFYGAKFFPDEPEPLNAEYNIVIHTDTVLATSNGLEFEYDVNVSIDDSDDQAEVSKSAQVAFKMVNDIVADENFAATLNTNLNVNSFSTTTSGEVNSPLGVHVKADRTNTPTRAPTMAPTAQPDYTNSPLIMYGAIGGVGLIAFLYFCTGHHSKPNAHHPAKKATKKTSTKKATKNPAATPVKAAAGGGAVAKPTDAPAPAPAVVERA